MLGQWIGGVNGTNSGILVINLDVYDSIRNCWRGRVSFSDTNPSLHNLYACIQIKNENNTITGDLYDYFVYFRDTRRLIGRNELMQAGFKDFRIPTKATFHGSYNESEIKGEWFTDVETKGNFYVKRSNFSKCFFADIPEVVDWDSFKKWASIQKQDGYIYRGQKKPAKLRTAFHRYGRNDLIRFVQDDMRQLGFYINAISSYKYNLNDTTDSSALLSLGQHYGFPTPLLDWTESPYVAAFFAFKDIEKRKVTSDKVRILMFDYNEWKESSFLYRERGDMLDTLPTITFHVLPVLNNERAIPQQSVFMFSNIDDIEEWVQQHELQNKRKYIFRIDLPCSERNKAISDLRRMGITQASLFPGIGGVCEFLREKLF